MTRASRQQRTDRREAFEAVVHRYEGPLLRYAGHVLNDADAAQDVVQEAFIRLLHHWKEPLDPCAKLSNWLYRVAYNCAVDYLRKRTRQRLLYRRFADEIAPAVPPDRGRGFRIGEAAARAAAALDTLPMRERQLVILKVYEEKSYKEISAITGLTVGNVGYILHHAMKKLAAVLQREGQPHD